MIPGDSTSDAAPFRVLASAYACWPDRGSEPGIGWHWARQIALHHELTLVTRPQHVEAARGLARVEGLPMQVLGHELSRPMTMWERRSKRTAHALWQRSVAETCEPLVREQRFDVAHDLTLTSGELPSSLGRLGIPFVAGPIGGATKDSMAQSDVILAFERSVGDHLPRRLRERVRPMLTCGVEAAAIVEARPRDWRLPLRLVLVRRRLERAELQLALRALTLLRRKHGATLEIVGGEEGGVRSTEITSRAMALGLGDEVRAIGPAKHAETLHRMRRADVLLQPCLGSFGTVAVEAMASGCAVVGFEHGVTGAVLASGRGIALPLEASRERMAEKFAEALGRLVVDEPLRLETAERGNAWARHVATWDAKGSGLTSIYAAAIEHRRTAGREANRSAA